MAYEVAIPVFEGPFDLLLHLILREQVELWEVDLARIVDAYLVELQRLDTLDLDVATEFLLIAATLVELKTRRLLPGSDDVDLDEEFGLWEQRDLLLSKLLECKTFKDASAALQRMAERAERSYARRTGMEEQFLGLTPDLLEGITPQRLHQAYLKAITPKQVNRVDLEHVAPIRLSVWEAIDELADELPRIGKITFRRLTGQMVERLEIIVRFLAVLELFKQGLVDLVQGERFGDIVIEWKGDTAGIDAVDRELVDSYEG